MCWLLRDESDHSAGHKHSLESSFGSHGLAPVEVWFSVRGGGTASIVEILGQVRFHYLEACSSLTQGH